MASLTGFTLPEIKDSDLNDEKQRRQILEYLYQLTEQLRFTLSNLDEENFSDSVSDNIQGAYTAASSASKEVKDMSGNVSRIKQFADTLTLAVENGDTSSSIALMANGVQIASEEIILKGAVTFTDLSTAGRTTINGSNITTGTIDADLIDVDNLYVKHLNGADGTFSGTLSAPVGEIGGFDINRTSLTGTAIELYPSVSGGRIVLGDVELEGTNELGVSSNVVAEGFYTDGDLDVGGTIYTDLPSSSGGDTVYWGSSTRRLVYHSSSERYKKDIETITDAEALKLLYLRPVTFRYKEDDADMPSTLQYGVIAEETQPIYPEMIGYMDGKINSMHYDQLFAPMIKLFQIQQQEIMDLKGRIAALEAKEE